MNARVCSFGALPDGTPVQAFTIGDPDGVELNVLDFGAAVQSLWVPEGDGKTNIVLGHSCAADYVRYASDYVGVVVGRYANRIAGASFVLDGKEHSLAANNDGACHHGGKQGFSHRVWSVESVTSHTVTFGLTSPDGDQGFPGRLQAQARYMVQGATVTLEIEATTDQPTIFGPTSHVYWNVAGENSGVVDEHVLTVNATHFLPVDQAGVPNGPLQPVEGTPLDFRTPRPIGTAIRANHHHIHNGLDHSFQVRGSGVRHCATVKDPSSKRSVAVFSDLPAVQVYTSNFFQGTTVGSSGTRYRQGDGVALEPQFHPDTPHHLDLGDPVLRPGQVRRHRIEWHVE